MTYKPTTYKYKGRTYTYYLTYDLPMTMRFRDGSTKRVVVPRVKRVYVSGKLESYTKRPSTYTSKLGTRVYGIKLVYENPRQAFYKSGFVGEHGKLKGVRVSGARIPRAKVTTTKIIPVPSNARNIKLRKTLPKKYKKTLMDIK